MRAKQWQAVGFMLLGRSTSEVADVVGVSPRTVTRWLKTPEFKDAFRLAQTERLDALVCALASKVELAVVVATEVLTGAKSDNTRLRAAGLVMDYALKYSARGIEERVSEAEERLARIEEAIGAKAEGY